MPDFIAPLGDVSSWIRGLADEHPTFFPSAHGAASQKFARINKNSEICFEGYRPTTTPPVKMLFPARDELFHFKGKDKQQPEAHPVIDSSFRILAGVRPCDLKGIFLMDHFFKDGLGDPYYLSRRENTAIIGYACPTPCDDRAFCAAVNSVDHRDGADVMLTPLGGGDLLVEAVTKKGTDLLKSTKFKPCSDGAAKKVGAVAARPEQFGRSFEVSSTSLPDILGRHWDSPVFQKHSETCFSCGTCNLVCPTCYCFDVRDELNLDTFSGTRLRTWDGCMLPLFASVAGGHNFRSQPASRQRHRVKRKFEYLPNKFGAGLVCVGCGRCGRQCTSKIDIFDIVEDLISSGGRS